ncbi:hypothetical protein VB777_17085 [Synechococcus sp. CCY9202]|nr:hypothetical protein [Synechococcus sp. CCY9202]MEA5424879.1 hypothetical protein [Synechococcus sp. CCY9202]
MAQSRLSFHLKVLKEAALIAARQEGPWVYDRLQPGVLNSLQAWLARRATNCAVPATACR